MNDLLKLLKIEAAEITTGFERASLEGKGTSQEISDRREERFKKFLSQYFPFPFRIVKGNVIDSYGERSNSIDCLVLSPSHPYTVNPSNDKASIIMADGVDYAIEIKPDLASPVELGRGLKQIQSIKKLRRVRTGLIGETNRDKIEYAKQIPGIIFAEKTYVDIYTLISNIVDYYVENAVPKNEQFDLIVINHRAIIFNFKENSYVASGKFEGIGYSEIGENTIAVFLLLMNRMPKSEPEISKNIMKIYLDDQMISAFKQYEELNVRLRGIEKGMGS